MRRHPSHERGRPPHPDVLTPAEWQVLEHVRRGRSNADIADHLDVSVNTVRTHVSSMLAKLELPDRTALARWDGEPSAASLEVIARRGSAPAAGPLAWLRGLPHVLGSSARVVAAVGATGIIAAVVVAAAAMSREDPRPPSSDALPPPTASPEVTTPTVTPAATAIVPTRPIVVGAPYRPTNLAMIVASDNASTQSDRMPDRIDRVTFDASGDARTETLLEASELGWGQFQQLAARPDGLVIVASQCTRGDCALMGNTASADAQTTLVRTSDGGKTWAEWLVLDGAYYANAFVGDDLLLIHFRSVKTDAAGVPRYDQSYVTVDPAGRQTLIAEPSHATWIPNIFGSDLVWPTDDRTTFVKTDSSVAVRLDIDGWADAGAVEVFPVGSGWAAVVTGDPCKEPGRESYICLMLFDAGGEPTQIHPRLSVGRVYTAGRELFCLARVDNTEGLMLLDLVAGEVRPIAEFLSPEWLARDRMQLLSVAPGS